MNYSEILVRRDELNTAHRTASYQYTKQLSEQDKLLTEKIEETAKFILDHSLAISSWNAQFEAEWGEPSVIHHHIHYWNYDDLVEHCKNPRIEGFRNNARAVWSIYNREGDYNDEFFSFSLKLIEDDSWREEFAALHQSNLDVRKTQQREADLAELERLKAKLGGDHA